MLNLKIYTFVHKKINGGKMSKENKIKTVFEPIYMLSYKPSSGCEFFEVLENNGNYYARCKVIDSLITKSKVNKCENYWKDCPYRRLSLKSQRGIKEL